MSNEQRSPVHVTAIGDVSLNGHYEKYFQQKGRDYPCKTLLPRWSKSDLLIGNLESPITNGQRFAPAKCTLRGAKQTVDFLRSTDFAAVTLANNHTMDYGPRGLLDTIDQLSAANMNFVGAGKDAVSASELLILERADQTIGLLNYCDVEQTSLLYASDSNEGVNELVVEKCVDEITAARSKVDWLIVNLHWGMEMTQIPSPQQRTTARRFVQAGADLIFGHHPHVLQPMERIEGVPVFYSLGNFLFSDMYWKGKKQNGQLFASRLRLHPLSRLTGWAEVEFCHGSETKANFFPARLKRDLSVVADHRSCRVRQWKALSKRLLASDYQAEWDREVKLADARTAWRWAWKPLLRRVEMRLYWRGWLPNVVEGT